MRFFAYPRRFRSFVTLVRELACASATPNAIMEYSIESEVSAALYRASATQAALDRQSDVLIRSLRDEIETLQVRVAAVKDLRANLAAKRASHRPGTAERDRAYAQEIAVFRNAVEDIASKLRGWQFWHNASRDSAANHGFCF
jgi:hypothetical protein